MVWPLTAAATLYVADIKGRKVLEYNASLTLINTITNASMTDPITIAISAPALAAAPPMLTPSALAASQFTFTLTGTTGSNYVVQASTNLSGNNWVSLLNTNAQRLSSYTQSVGTLPRHNFIRGAWSRLETLSWIVVWKFRIAGWTA